MPYKPRGPAPLRSMISHKERTAILKDIATRSITKANGGGRPRKPIPPGLDPAVAFAFDQVYKQKASEQLVSIRAGFGKDTMVFWRSPNRRGKNGANVISDPRIKTLRAHLNVLGWDLAVVPLREKNDG